ncbi:HAD family hydrolase [Desulfobacterales bacterium HSG16]|nr:HAD family hydrolase [Desulfobacterales bacterium HSG16]
MTNKQLILSHIRSHIQPLEPVFTGQKASGVLKHDIFAVLFDIYGTLLISASGDIDSASYDDCNLRYLFDRYNIGISVRKLREKLVRAIKKEHALLKIQGIDFPEVDIVKIWKEITYDTLASNRVKDFVLEYELITNPVWPMPNLKKTIEAFNQRRMPMGIISNAQFYTPLILEAILESRIEDCGICPDLVFFSYIFSYAKPSEFMFDAAASALKQLNILPKNVLYVGNDMLNDILPAKKTGFQTALFAGDMRSLRLREDNFQTKDVFPDLVITDLFQLVGHIESVKRI